ncbi:NAD(P)H-dependent glycerol-3-phosphate dehydrogenase [Pseudogemmobacter faecipullorum]|uniref:Glycerol-3-phosphate dehydrogenase [NAD(P)+] n=1 Tax=Pseudogemmobacter faecipullorum TaxID=2755041 RepID=A0ABS8CJ61_9RHOB|nr:NAD(P)H-dependent glycerol-3-phosphate dehydrogenase [Pseudogemmobacter faecipullorum]MCB5409437.1 NAD(P)-dependent glycerol-3-phosphate dehydrogenase [Pseudogemmobacter faecipullorum]
MIGIAGAGAFGTALAVALAHDGREVWLYARDPAQLQEMQHRRINPKLPGITLPQKLHLTGNLADLAITETVLLAMPMQAMRAFLASAPPDLLQKDLVACSKGIDLTTLQGPGSVMAAAGATGARAMLTGPSFASDIARGLPTALTLACACPRLEALQHLLSTATLRLYRSEDVIGAELGGALKNVIAIAAGIVIGAGFGDSARAALITRGYAEMSRLASSLGAKPETLAGLSGLGDLILTCTSGQSRNFTHGLALGAGTPAPEATVEGLATARAATRLARERGIDMPVTSMVARLAENDITLGEAVRELMSRPLKQE